jgi:hypothetical protein
LRRETIYSHSRAATHRNGGQIQGERIGQRANEAFRLTIGHEPNYLVPLFKQAFELPAVPSLQRLGEASESDEHITEEDLALSVWRWVRQALVPRDPQGGSMQLQSALYDLEARVCSASKKRISPSPLSRFRHVTKYRLAASACVKSFTHAS